MMVPGLTSTPVENAVFPNPMPGRYLIGVNACCRQLRIPAGSAYRVTILQAGKPDRIITGVAQTPGLESSGGVIVGEVVVPP